MADKIQIGISVCFESAKLLFQLFLYMFGKKIFKLKKSFEFCLIFFFSF